MNKRLITTFLFLLVVGYLFGQKDTSVLRSQSATECFEMSTKNKDYIIRINNIDYEDGDDVFICKDNSYNIEIRYNNVVMDSVIADSWDWSNCGCINGNPQSFKATLVLQTDDKMKVKFIVDGKKKDLTLDFKIVESLKIDIKKTHKNKTYEYDENNTSKYPYYSNKYDWKYLSKDSNDVIFFTKKSSTLFSQNIVNSIPVENNNLNGLDGHLEITHLGSSNVDSFEIKLCDHITPILKVDVNEVKKIPINIYTLYESDDDKANYCIDYSDDGIPYQFGQNGMSTDDLPGQRYKANCIDLIDNIEHECIDPGDDGSLDLYKNLSSWVDYSSDIITINNHTARILAGTDLKCSTLPRQNEIDTFTHNFDFIELEQEANEFYNKLGIELEFHNRGGLAANYDVSKDDSKLDLDITSGKGENIPYYQSNFISPSIPDTTIIWIVPELFDASDDISDGSLIFKYGNSPFLKSKVIFLSAKYTTKRTIAHELGHSNFGLVHPDGNFHSKNDLPEKISSDRYNFMNSGNLFKSYGEKLKDLRIRSYQWKLIHKSL